MNNYDTRDRVLEMVEEGYISSDQALLMCLKWMSQDDVDGMMEANELKEIDEEEENDFLPLNKMISIDGE
tara:strand:+ start:40 stop:249 length:210 start_codon:yes stop_codon:yes gene_type:complete